MSTNVSNKCLRVFKMCFKTILKKCPHVRQKKCLHVHRKCLLIYVTSRDYLLIRITSQTGRWDYLLRGEIFSERPDDASVYSQRGRMTRGGLGFGSYFHPYFHPPRFGVLGLGRTSTPSSNFLTGLHRKSSGQFGGWRLGGPPKTLNPKP